uniref:peptide-methionine (R)-S-oxide reductase n=1 Tax=Globodera rostochiensis TaxID=31243 RepID=A0A914H360_GLORO
MTSRNERHSDTWDVLKQWTKSQHQRVSRFYNPETVVQLFDHLEKTQQQLHFAVQEKNTLAGQNMRMKQQIENFEVQLGLSNATIRQLRTELAAKSEVADSLRIELREHQLTFHTAINDLQNITVRRSRFDDTVSQSTKRGGTDARNKTLVKSRVRCCPSPSSPLRMPSEKRAKRMSEVEEDDDRLNVGPTLTPRRKPLLPPPLVLTPLTHYFPRRSVSEPRPTPATPKFAPFQEQQQHHQPQRTDGVEESNEKYDNFGPTTTTTTTNFCCHPPGRMLMPPVHMTNSGGGTALCFSSYASTSSISSTPLLGGGFSADSSSMLGPVTWTQSGKGAAQQQQKSSWIQPSLHNCVFFFEDGQARAQRRSTLCPALLIRLLIGTVTTFVGVRDNEQTNTKKSETIFGQHLIVFLCNIFRPIHRLIGRALRVPSAVTVMASSRDGNGPSPAIEQLAESAKMDPKAVTEDEWRKVLSPEAFEVTRRAGTEAQFTGKFDKHFVAGGKYTCVCCGADLFLSEHKFNSGCGWPAFSKSVGADQNIVRLRDNSFGRQRTEIRCAKCDAHLGHVFDDGPPADGGERYCVNSVSIDFVFCRRLVFFSPSWTSPARSSSTIARFCRAANALAPPKRRSGTNLAKNTWDVLKQWTKSQHQRVSRFYNPETVVQLFDHLEKTQQQLHFAVQEKNTLAGQNMRMKQQIEFIF